MGTAYEPDGSYLRVGVWGTDCNYEVSANARSGDGYWEFKATTPAADPELEYDDFIPVNELSPYSHYAWVRASSIAGGDTVRVATEWYDNTRALIGAAVDNFNAVLPAINTWYRLGSIIDSPANARYAKIFISKNNTAFTVRLDRFDLKPHPFCFHAYRNADQNVTNGADLIEFNAETYDYGSWLDTATGIATIPEDGVYTFNAQSQIELLDTNEVFSLLINNITTGKNMGAAPLLHAWADDQNLPNAGNTSRLFSRGDTVAVYSFHNHVGNLNLTGDADGEYTWFSGQKVE